MVTGQLPLGQLRWGQLPPRLACTFQTVQHPVWAVGGVNYRLKIDGKGPRFD